MKLDLDALDALLAKMSPRPWRTAVDGSHASIYQVLAQYDPEPDVHIASMSEMENGPNPDRDPDANGIVAIVNAAAALIARVRELEAAVRRASTELGHHESEYRHRTDPQFLANLRALLSTEGT